MKILYICTYYHRAMVFRDSMNYLESMGNQVLAFNAVEKGAEISDKYKAIMDEKVVHCECFNKNDRYIYKYKQKKIEKAVCENVNLKEFDIIHSHTLFNGGWVAYQLKKKYGIPYIVSVRNTDINAFLKHNIFRGIARKIANDAAGILFLSDAYKKKFLLKCYSESETESILKKCYVIPNGLEPFWLDNIAEPRSKVQEPLSLLCVGKIDQNKNVERVLDVVVKLNERGIKTHFTVIGQVLDQKVLNLISDNKYVTVVPYLTKEELINYYRKNDIFVMPSFRESFGRVYAEAMTQGLPVIYTRGQGFDETFPRGLVGYDVSPADTEEIISAVLNIKNNYAEISQRCIENCRIFDWSVITGELQNMYENSI